MAPTPWTLWHTETQRPQRMHLLDSLTIDGEEMSMGCVFLMPEYFLSRIPRSEASAASSQFPLRGQKRQSSGWLARSSSTIFRRACWMRGVCVRTTIPSWAIRVQLVWSRGIFSTSTMQTRQAACGVGEPSKAQRWGMSMPARSAV